MRNSKHLVSWRSYGVAFAIALSPALMQTGDLTCAKTGDPTLSTLEVEVSGQNRITAFDPEDLSYDVWLPRAVDTAIVRAYSTDPGSQVMYNYSDGSPPPIDYGSLPVGGGEHTLDGLLPEGGSRLLVSVQAPEKATYSYVVNVRVGCSDCDDASACTADSCNVAQQVCVHDWFPGGGECAFPCTEQGIRDAITVGGGPHEFDCDGPTTVVTTDTIVIDNDVILDGAGTLTVDGLDGSHSVVSVSSDVTAELHGFLVTHSALPAGWWWGGGGIVNEGTLTLTSSTVSGNYGAWADCSGARPPCWTFGGGVLNAPGATLTLMNSTVSGNDATDGSGIINFGTAVLVLMNSTVSGNTSSSGILNVGTATLTNSTVSGNFGDGIRMDGDSTTVTHLTNSTVSNNGGAGLLDSRQQVLVRGTLTVTNSTLSGNVNEGIFSNGLVTIGNSIIVGDCFVPALYWSSVGYNIESPGNTCGFNQEGDQLGVTAEQLNLASLADNGGPTETHALLPGSVAIDHIPEANCAVTTDQRGVARPQGTACDVGALELEQ